MMQANIDQADSPDSAYTRFSHMTGNSYGAMMTKEGGVWNPTEVDSDKFKAKLKNMLRMYHDYPELAGQIGDMKQVLESGVSMNTSGTYGKRQKASIGYNPSDDRVRRGGFFASIKRFFTKDTDPNDDGGFSVAPSEYNGNHELGHVLNSLIIVPGGDLYDAENDWYYSDTANEMVNTVLADEKILSKKDRKKLRRHTTGDKEKRIHRGQLDTQKSGLHKLGLTSGYGEKSAAEFFAEAFADVYTHGRNARPASIKLVKEYEKRRHLIPKKQLVPAEIQGLDDIPDEIEEDDLLNTSISEQSDMSSIKSGRKKKK